MISISTTASVFFAISVKFDRKDSSARTQSPTGSTTASIFPAVFAAYVNANAIGVVPGAVSTMIAS